MKKFFFFLFLICIASLPFTSGIRITGGIHNVDFEPNLSRNFSYSCGSKPLINVEIEGELAKYATIHDDNPGGPPRSFKIELNLPESLDRPGKWTLYVTVIEVKDVQGFIGTIESATFPIYIHYPYPGYFIEGKIKTDQIEVNDVAIFDLFINNRGENEISDLSYEITILDEYGELVETVKDSYNEIIPSTETTTIPVSVDTFGWFPGIYTVKAHVDYHGKSVDFENKLTIGDLQPILVEFSPKVLLFERINEVSVVIRANWRTPKNVYSKLYIDDNYITKTPTEKLGDFKSDRFIGYLDTTGFKQGDHKVTIEMIYDGESKSESVDIVIDENAQLVTFNKPEKQGNSVLVLAMAAAIVVFIALIVMMYLIFKK